MQVSATIQEVKSELEQLVNSATSAQELMSGLTALLYKRMLKYNWVGFYMIDEGTQPPVLVLGPFQGAMTPHTRIPLHQGIFQDARFRAGEFDTKFMERFLAGEE